MPKKESHWGEVINNKDPAMQGRLTIKSPSVVADDVLEWVSPTFHFVDSEKNAGSFWIPNIGSLVEIEIESESDSEMSGLEPKWKCSIYPDGTVPEEFKENYPERRGWKTAQGHLLMFDDTNGSLTFLYRHPTSAEITIDNDGNIYLKAASGKSVNIGNDADKSIVLGEELLNYFNTALTGLIAKLNGHAHVETGATTLAPSNALAPLPYFSNIPTTVLSDSNKVR